MNQTSAKAGTSLSLKLKTSGEAWFVTFQKSTVAQGLVLKQPTLSDAAGRYVSIVQLGVVSATLQEQGYLKNLPDVMFFLELIYGLLTHRLPAQLHEDIETLPFALTGDIQKALAVWASTMANEISPTKDDATLIKELIQHGMLLIVQARVDTCAACNDLKAALRLGAALSR